MICHWDCDFVEFVILEQDSGFLICSAVYTYRFCKILYKEERRGSATFKGRWLWARAQFIRTTTDRTALHFTNKASRILFVIALFIYLLSHIAYPEALEYRVLVFRRIGISEAEGWNSKIFQKFSFSDFPLLIFQCCCIQELTLVYNKPCSIHLCLVAPMTRSCAPYQEYDRLLIGVAVLSTFKHYRARALYQGLSIDRTCNSRSSPEIHCSMCVGP